MRHWSTFFSCCDQKPPFVPGLCAESLSHWMPILHLSCWWQAQVHPARVRSGTHLLDVFETLGKYWESLPTLPYQPVLSTRISAASSYVGYDGSASPDSLGPKLDRRWRKLTQFSNFGVWKKFGKVFEDFYPYHPWDWYIYLHENHKDWPNVGTYTSPMDPMGLYHYNPTMQFLIWDLFFCSLNSLRACKLGGGNSKTFLFSPRKLGKIFSNLTCAYFSKWVGSTQPPTSSYTLVFPNIANGKYGPFEDWRCISY